MRYYQKLFFVLNLTLVSSVSIAQQYSYSGVIAENIAEEQQACASDAARFCGGNVMALFEMEICLSHYTRQLTPACKEQIAPTDFKKYHKAEEDLFD